MYNIRTYVYHLSLTLDVKHTRPLFTCTHRYNTCSTNILHVQYRTECFTQLSTNSDFLTYSKNILYILQYIYIFLLDIFILLIRVLIDTILEALIYCMYIIELNVSHITNSFFTILHQYVTITKCNNTKFTWNKNLIEINEISIDLIVI